MARTKPLQGARHGALQVKVNDCLLFKPAKGSLPYGRVLGIVSSGSLPAGIRLRVNWFYRPEKAKGGRKPFYGQQELLASDHTDDGIPLASVLGSCRVHGLEQYKQLQEAGKLSEGDFFSRYLYKSGAQVFEPEMVPVYCLCEMPFNPDKPMSQCRDCLEWYHHECIEMSEGAGSVPAVATAADPEQLEDQQCNSGWRCRACLDAVRAR